MRNFNTNEFDSPDLKGSGEKMDSCFLEMLDSARDIAGIPFKINSGYRTLEHNAKVGGVNSSSHTRGLAVDIACKDSRARFIIVSALKDAGFTRIGISNSFIHVDSDSDKAQDVIWTY